MTRCGRDGNGVSYSAVAGPVRRECRNVLRAQSGGRDRLPVQNKRPDVDRDRAGRDNAAYRMLALPRLVRCAALFH